LGYPPPAKLGPEGRRPKEKEKEKEKETRRLYACARGPVQSPKAKATAYLPQRHVHVDAGR